MGVGTTTTGDICVSAIAGVGSTIPKLGLGWEKVIAVVGDTIASATALAMTGS
jgi:hypothetical protein